MRYVTSRIPTDCSGGALTPYELIERAREARAHRLATEQTWRRKRQMAEDDSWQLLADVARRLAEGR